MQQTHRRGDTCVARNTGAPQSTRTPQLIAQPARIRRHPTRPVNCAVPAPGVMNGAPTSYAAKQPTRNNVQPPQCSRRTVGATLVSPGTPPPVIPPLPNPHTHAPPQRATRPSRRRTTRPVNCAVPAPGVMNGAPTSYAAKQPTRNNVQPPQCSRRTVGATLVSPGTPPPPIHTHTALNAQPDRSLSPAGTRTGVTNVPLRRQKKRHPCP